MTSRLKEPCFSCETSYNELKKKYEEMLVRMIKLESWALEMAENSVFGSFSRASAEFLRTPSPVGQEISIEQELQKLHTAGTKIAKTDEQDAVYNPSEPKKQAPSSKSTLSVQKVDSETRRSGRKRKSAVLFDPSQDSLSILPKVPEIPPVMLDISEIKSENPLDDVLTQIENLTSEPGEEIPKNKQSVPEPEAGLIDARTFENPENGEVDVPSLRLKCADCQTTNTTTWRRGENDQRVCNSCGLYFAKHKTKRPIIYHNKAPRPRTRLSKCASIPPSPSLAEPNAALLEFIARFSNTHSE